jgi:arylsulfatase A-like enzyme
MGTLGFKCMANQYISERLTSSEIGKLINLYDASINYIDDNLGRLFQSLEKKPANTIIVLIGDHGEAFGEHGSLGHNSLYEVVIRVPLIIAGSKMKNGFIYEKPVSLMDLAPTITDLLGISPVPSFHGRSLLPLVSIAQNETNGYISTAIPPRLGKLLLSYRTQELKYICCESLREANTLLSEEVYNLFTDPSEKHSLFESKEDNIRDFILTSRGRIKEFKQLKRAEETVYEKERIRAKVSWL